MSDSTLRIIPLGGVGEVGKNMMALEYGDDIMVVDAGLKFPEEDMLGIDLVIPDISYLQQNAHRVRGIVITHGHEDHVGALPFVLRDLNVPLFCTSLTRGLISVKLKEHRLLSEATINLVTPRQPFNLGCFRINALPVNHSIPDGVALMIDTPEGLVVHTGDFKFDASPVGGQPTDLAAIAEIGRKGVLALLSDSVRVERPGCTPSERAVGETLDAVISSAKGRVIVTTFASNISRVQQVVDVAYRYNRKVAILGRSLVSNLGIASKLGFIHVPEDTVWRFEQVRKLPHSQCVFVTTGSQGEPTSVLSRIANDEHPQLQIIPGDTVVIAATPVPGNEETVGRTIDNLLRLGADVIYDAVMRVHVSGHASRDELRQMLDLLKPKYCMPLHGDFRHMVLYRKLAMETGVPFENVLMPDLGDIVEVTQERAWLGSTVPAGAVLVDGVSAGAIGERVLEQRQQLARDGIAIAAVTIDRASGQIISGPDIATRGFVEDEDSIELLGEARDELRKVLRTVSREQLNREQVSQRIRESLTDYFYQATRRKPIVLPIVSEL